MYVFKEWHEMFTWPGTPPPPGTNTQHQFYKLNLDQVMTF